MFFQSSYLISFPEPQVHVYIYFSVVLGTELWASHSFPKCFTTESHSLFTIEFSFFFLETGHCHVNQVGSQLMTSLPQPLGAEIAFLSLCKFKEAEGCFVFFPNTLQLLITLTL